MPPAASFIFLLIATLAAPLEAQQTDLVAQALAQGDAFQKQRNFEKALEAYQKADKLSHHSSVPAYLSMAVIQRKLGSLDIALDEAKHALKAAGDNKLFAIQAHLFRATLLMQMSAKPTDKKLREAEDDIRQALALNPDYALSHFSLGLVLLRQEHDDEGVAELKNFVSLPGAPAPSVAEARKYIAAPVRAREPFAPDFSFTTLEREQVTSAGLRGKVVLLDFWGTWCPPCRESVPMLKDLNKKYTGKAFQLVGISSDQDEDVLRTFIQKQRMDWLEYIDLSSTVQEAFNVESFPTYIVLDKDGVVRFRQSGLSNETGSEIEDVINKALKRAPDPALAAAAAPPPATAAGSSAPVAEAASPTGNVVASPPEPAEGVELWSVSGNVYENGELGLSYEFPKGWTAAKPETIRDANQRMLAAVTQHAPTGGNVRVPKTVFYASPRGGDGLRMSLPSLRINAAPGGGSRLTLEYFDAMTQRMFQSGGIKLLGAPSEFVVKKHHFMRADLEQNLGSSHFYRSYILTQAADYLVTIEIIAASQDELKRIAASLDSVSFREDQE